MTNPAPFSTLEQFAKSAGIPEKIGHLIIGEESFVVTTKSGVYFAEFSRNKNDVAYFSSPILGRALTREEARDAMEIIQYYLPKEQSEIYAPILKRLNDNLPHLGFRLDTPLMGSQKHDGPY
jgi:hypothetical protein